MDLAFPAMEPYKGILIVVGTCYLFSFIAGILSVAQSVDDPDYLRKAALNSKQINKAAFFQFLMAIFYCGIAIGLYPVLKQDNELLALGFLGFRMMAVFFVLIGTFLLLRIGKLSQEYVKAGAPDSARFNRRGKVLKRSRDLVNHVVMVIMLCIGGILLYLITLQSGLIPAWLSVWGLIGSSIAIGASILVMLRHVEVLRPTYVVLNIPIAVQEIVFAGWLIAIGFN